MAGKGRGGRPPKRGREECANEACDKKAKSKKKLLVARSGVLQALEGTTGEAGLPDSLCSKAYELWSDFHVTKGHTTDDLISILKVSTFMQDPSTAEKAASMLAGICRTEFADQYISYLERLSEGKFSAMPLSSTLKNLAKDLDGASLAFVLSHVPFWHLAGAAPALSNTALVAHGLTKQEDLRLDKHFGQGIGVMEESNHQTDEDSEWGFGNDDVGEEQHAAADCEHGEGEAEAAHPPPRLHHFAKFLSGMTLPRTVKSLSLAGNDLDADMVYLAGMSKNLESMTHLDISDNQIGAEGLCRLLPGLQQLQSLNLSRTGIDEDDFHLFMPMLSPLTSLTAVNMSQSNVSTGAAASVLMAALWPLHHLRSLMIEEEYLDDVVLEHTFKAPAFKRLEHFVASEFNLLLRMEPKDRSWSMDTLAAAAEDPAVRLKTLQLPLCCGTGAAIMLQAVSQLTDLECLRIRADPMPVPLADDEQEAEDGPEGAPVELPLGPSLAALPQLRTLCVVLTSATLVSFAGSVSALTCLTSLNLSDSVLEAPADAAGVARLAELKMLNVFIFNFVAFCEEVGDELRAMLPHLAALQELQVSNLTIATDTDMRLHEVLPSLRSLQKLVLGSEKMMLDFGPVPIWLSDLAVLAPMTQLTHLDVRTLSPEESGAPIPEASPQQAEAAYAALAGLTSLEYLTLQGFGVACPADPATVVQQTDNFLLNLTDVLDKMPRLSELTIHDCPLWEGQAEAFGAALSRRTALSKVHMVNCGLVDGSAHTIARHLHLLPRLRDVSMAENAIVDLNGVRKILASTMATSWDLNLNLEDAELPEDSE